MVKNPPGNAGDASSIPRSEVHLKKDVAAHSPVLAW